MSFDEPTLSFSKPGPNPSSVDFGAAAALAAMQRDQALQAMAQKFDAQSRLYDTLTPGLKHIWRTSASDANANFHRETLLDLGKQGVTPEAWAQPDAQLSEALKKAQATLAGQRASPTGTASPRVDGLPAAFAAPALTKPPESKPDPRLKGPSTLQLAAGGLFALLAPKYAALALAAPFQEGLRQHERDIERTRSENADAYVRWRDGLDGATVPMDFGAPGKLGADVSGGSDSLKAPATETISPRVGAASLGTVAPVPKSPFSGSKIHHLLASDKFNAANAEAYKVRGDLLQSRLRWVDKAQAGRIAKRENDAEYSRRKAYDMVAGTRQRASPASLTTLLARLRDARDRTSQELRSLQTQEAALATLAEWDPDSYGDDLERIRTLKTVRVSDLQRLGDLSEQTWSRLEAPPSGPRPTSETPLQGWTVTRKK